MERYSEVVGLPVICIGNGKKIGIVKDILLNQELRRVKAIMIETKGYSITKKAIKVEDIRKLGKDAVIVDDRTCVKNLKNVDFGHPLKSIGKDVLDVLRIYTKNGEDLGIVKDILIDFGTAHVEGMEISDGIFHDIVQGRKILPLFGKVEFSEENILVDKEAIEEMTHTGGGLKNKILGQENNIKRKE